MIQHPPYSSYFVMCAAPLLMLQLTDAVIRDLNSRCAHTQGGEEHVSISVCFSVHKAMQAATSCTLTPAMAAACTCHGLLG
jgi:hypothetical protein